MSLGRLVFTLKITYPSLIFVFACKTRPRSSTAQTSAQVNVSYQHYSLLQILQIFVNYNKSFSTLIPGLNVYKTLYVRNLWIFVIS
jgi:hypothetical protein